MRLKKVKVFQQPPTWIVIDQSRDSEEAKTDWLEKFQYQERFFPMKSKYKHKRTRWDAHEK